LGQKREVGEMEEKEIDLRDYMRFLESQMGSQKSSGPLERWTLF